MSDDLLAQTIATTGGQEPWKTLRALRIDISIGGPIWAMKGWPPDKTFDQMLTLDTVRERIVFTPFTRPDRRMIFDAASDSVTMETLDGEPAETLAPASVGWFATAPGTPLHLGYFLGYACWNYFTIPFLFTYAGVQAREIEPWLEAGQTWRRLQVRFRRRLLWQRLLGRPASESGTLCQGVGPMDGATMPGRSTGDR